MAKAPFNATVQTTVAVCGDPGLSPVSISISPASYQHDQKLSISAYGDVELVLSEPKVGTIGRARIGVLNSAIRDGILAYPAALCSKYDSAETLRENALWLADLATAITAAQLEIADLLQPAAVPA